MYACMCRSLQIESNQKLDSTMPVSRDTVQMNMGFNGSGLQHSQICDGEIIVDSLIAQTSS